MKRFFRTSVTFFAVLAMIFAVSCNSKPENPNVPEIDINFTIYPNSMEYYELNVVGGWMYVTAPLPSRGIIIYRYNIDEFRAYERMAPNYPYACDNNRLFVDFPFIMDTCSNYKYSILDGSIIEGGDGYPVTQYFTSFDGSALRVYN